MVPTQTATAVPTQTPTLVSTATATPTNTPQQPETDQDGVPDIIEDSAPNNGDGNNDGVRDSKQSNVTTLLIEEPQPAVEPNSTPSSTKQYVTLAVPAGQQITNVTQSNEMPDEAKEEPLPVDVETPLGHIAFDIANVAPSKAVSVTLWMADADRFDSYYKFGPTPDNPTPHWYEFLYDGATGAEMLSDRIILHFVDGQRGDHDLRANGVIEDPGAPVQKQEPTEPARSTLLPLISN